MREFFFRDCAQFERECRTVATAFGRPDAVLNPVELHFLDALTSRDWSGIGQLSLEDIFFAAGATSILRPPLMIEIGTAAGFSATLFAQLMAFTRPNDLAGAPKTLVHTIDKNLLCPFDQTHPIGFAIALLAPELEARIAVHRGHDSTLCAQLAHATRIEFAFIDANHRHPWPLLDLLRLLPLVPAGWILLHDIDLPNTARRAEAAGVPIEFEPVAGAKHLFDFWPGKKISGGNIGAIEATSETAAFLPSFVARLRRLPSEVTAGSHAKRWREIDAALERLVLQDHGARRASPIAPAASKSPVLVPAGDR